MTGLPGDLSRFSINQMTVKQLTLPELTEACVRLGVPGVGLWREPVQAYGTQAAAKLVHDAGLAVTTLCRGGFLTASDPAARAEALDDNRAAIDEAVTLGTDTLVLVSGGLPAGSRDLYGARERIADALAVLAPYAGERGVRLAIEPLHPMYASDRCVVSTLDQALELAERFPAEQVGVVVDTYHVWWDARLAAEIARAGRRIVSFQVCDWVLPLPADTLLGRGHLGDGCIDFAPIAAAVAAAGYAGDVEVEIFNAEVWDAPPDQTAATVRERFAAVLGGTPGVRSGGGGEPRRPA